MTIRWTSLGRGVSESTGLRFLIRPYAMGGVELFDRKRIVRDPATWKPRPYKPLRFTKAENAMTAANNIIAEESRIWPTQTRLKSFQPAI